MRTCFTEALSREGARLSEVTDAETMKTWRHHLVEELRTPESPCLTALRQTEDARERADFLDQWRELIAQMVRRVLQFRISDEVVDPSPQPPAGDIDAEKTAVLILAALHGGSILSQLAQDAQPLNSALDFALLPLLTAVGDNFAGMGPNSPVANMDM